MLDEPRVNVTGKTMMEVDLLAMERLHNAVTAKPKVLSWQSPLHTIIIRLKTVMVNISTNINKRNNHLSPQVIEHKIKTT